MTRRLHRCLTCRPSSTPRRGYTRHRSGVCSLCRTEGVTATPGSVTVTIVADTRGWDVVQMLPLVADRGAPTLAELRAGTDLRGVIA